MNSAESSEQTDLGPTPSIQEQRVARVYAAALLNAAEAKEIVPEIKADLDELVQASFRQQPEFEDFLASGAVSKGAKEKALRAIFDGKVNDLFLNFLLVLNEHYRLDLLRAVHLVLNQLFDQRNRRIVVHVTTAVPLPEDQSNRLIKFLHDSMNLQPVLDVTVDPKILGGMMIRLGDWLFDRSVRSDLDTIRKQLIARSSHEIQSRRDRFSNSAGN